MQTATKRRPSRNKRPSLPRTIEQFSKLAPKTQETWNSVAHVVSRMRSERISLHEACREYKVDPRAVIRWGSSALRKLPNGRYAAKSRDQLLRVLELPSHQGRQEVAVRDSRHASKVAKYWAAVQKYLQTGDASGLKKFEGVRISDADGNPIPLITNLNELNRLGNAGVLSFESLYARSN